MFSDFDENARDKEGRGRRTVSLFLAGGIFFVLAAGVAAAVATAHHIARQQEDVDVEFATLDAPEEPEPEPEPEPPEPEPQRPRRAPPAAAASNAPPTSIPDARPDESEGALAEAGEVGPVDGSLDGVEGGTGPVEEPVAPPPPEPPPGPPRPPRPPPEQERVEVQPPRMLSGCQTPERPDSLEGQTAETIRIRVRVVVGADGRVMRATITEGHDLIPEETILGCVNTRIYEPATLEEMPVPYVMTYVFTFRPDIL